MGPRRDALVTAAMHLFAERGYAATSVADIQLAAGLTAGSGALYKHFASKEALLEAGIEMYLETLSVTSSDVVKALPDEPGAALEAIARGVINSMTDDRVAIRVLLRDLDAFPRLRDRSWEGVVAGVYARMTEWIESQSELGTVVAPHPAALSAVLIGALTALPILQTLVAKAPGDVATEVFIQQWVEVALSALQVGARR